MKGSMKKLRSLVNADIARSINIQDKLSKMVYEILDIDINAHNIWAVVKQQQLTLVTDHPIMATQLNFQKDMIRDQLNRRLLLELKSAQIKIAPPKAMRKIPKGKRFVISETSAKSLQGIAEMIDDDELKESLLQLTRHK
jgi:hypothetical protein